MIQVLYDFPLPNNGDRYDLSKEELQELLQHVYNCGFENARNRWDPSRQSTLDTTSNSKIYFTLNKGENICDFGTHP